MIYQWRLEPRQTDAALVAYEAAVETDGFTADWEAADCYYKRGEIFGWQGRDPRESIQEYRQALVLNPKHHWAQSRLGYALYRAYGDVVLAEKEIEQAIALWPDDKYRIWPHRVLGNIYREVGMIDKAIAAYREALRLDPSDEHVQDMLATLLEE